MKSEVTNEMRDCEELSDTAGYLKKHREAYVLQAKRAIKVYRAQGWKTKILLWIISPIAPIFWVFTCRKYIKR